MGHKYRLFFRPLDVCCRFLSSCHQTQHELFTYPFLYLRDRDFQKSISSSLEENFGIISVSMAKKSAEGGKKERRKRRKIKFTTYEAAKIKNSSLRLKSPSLWKRQQTSQDTTWKHSSSKALPACRLPASSRRPTDDSEKSENSIFSLINKFK